MKRIVIWASIQYAAHVNGATIHVTGPDERQVEFGDGTTSFATLSGGEGYINSTVNVYAPDFVTMTGTSVNEMVTLIQEQQTTIITQQVEIEALKTFVGMGIHSPPPPTRPPSSPPGTYIYILGGYACIGHPCNTGCRHRVMERYDPLSDTWSTPACASGIMRQGVAFAAVGGYLYAAGGAGNGAPHVSMQRYDPSSNSWSTQSSAPYDLPEGSSAVSFGGYMYAFGNPARNVQHYDPEANSWAVATTVPGTHTSRFMGVAVLGTLIYVVGGGTPSDAVNLAYSFSPGDGTPDFPPVWTALASMNCARYGPGVAVANELLYTNGGGCPYPEKSNIVERYDPALNTWTIVAPSLNMKLDIKMVNWGGYLYAFGEQDDGSVERYDPNDGLNGTWTAVASMLYARTDYGAALL